MNKNIIVTGGAGFLGTHLCNRLKLENYVISIDNYSTSTRKTHSYEKYCQPSTHDISRPVFSLRPIHQIYNLACPASPHYYLANPIETYKASTFGAFYILELAKKHNATILQASTSEVYGDAAVHPQPESYRGNVNTIGPRACYDEGKRAAESLFMDYRRIHGVNAKICRIFNTYGPGMRPKDGRVVSNFIIQALKNKPLTIYGDGTQTRSFCYVDDLIDGLIAAMNAEDFAGPVNLGNPGEVTMLELANTIIDLTQSKSKVKFFKLPEDDPRRRCPDISLAKEKLKWEPKVGLRDGLMKTIEWLRSNK